jgi:hypothetical protein
MVIAADYPLLDIIWTMFVFFAWVIWFTILIAVFRDLFRRDDISGWGKAAWMFFVIVLPFLGVLIYVGVHGKGMSQRNQRDVQTATEFAEFQRGGGATGSPTSQIAEAKNLLDAGTIDQAEFGRLKAQALA